MKSFLPVSVASMMLLLFLGCGETPVAYVPDKKVSNTHLDSFSLDELQKRSFQYFWDQIDAHYQVQDRYPTLNFTSIAATGFGITTYLIASERNFISRDEAAERVYKTLLALKEMPMGQEPTGVSGYKGFYYHFLDLTNARRYQKVELSSIDTGLLMAGILSAMTYFDKNNPTEENIRRLADELYRKVEWDWMMQPDGLMSMGWHPEKGFIPARWAGYNEAMILMVLGLGSPTHPIADNAWEKWCETYDWASFQGENHVNFDPLFGHQYSHMYIDFRGIQDAYMKEKGIDYFENSRRATLANRKYCIENPKGFIGYGKNTWGLTACDGPKDTLASYKGEEIQFHSYWARGAAIQQIKDDGTIAPTAAGGSIPFAPEICIPALENMWNTYGESLVGTYGFFDSFNPTYTFGKGNEHGWFDTDYLGIDQGPIVIQIENYRNEFVWNLMKKNPYIISGLKKAGFEGGWLNELAEAR